VLLITTQEGYTCGYCIDRALDEACFKLASSRSSRFLPPRPAVLAYLLVLHGTPHAGRGIPPFELFQLEEVFG
jgi:hypothetical protein